MAKGFSQSTPVLSPPVWLQSNAGEYQEYPARLNPDLFRDRDDIALVVGVAGALQNATSIPVASVTFPVGITKIPKGTWLNFGGAKTAQLSADYTGGSTLTVNAIPTAVVSGDTAYYSPYPGRKLVQAGTIVGRTYAERDAGTAFGPWAIGDDECFILVFDTLNALDNADCYLLKHDAVIKQNYLPNWSTISALVDEVQTVAITGTLSGGVVVLSANGIDRSIAYNANLAAIQAALDAIYGSGATVAAGTIASFTVTFSGAAVDEIDWAPLDVDISNCTGATAVTVSETTKGGNSLLEALRARYRLIVGVN